MAPSAATATAPYLFPLLPVLRLTINRVHSTANQLTSLAPDDHFDDLQRRILHLAYTLRAHCDLENNTVLPTLREYASPPQKRPRLIKKETSSIIFSSENNQLINFHDHPSLHNAFISIVHELTRLRNAPLLATDPASPNPVRRVSDDLTMSPHVQSHSNQSNNNVNKNPISSSIFSTMSRSSLLSTVLDATETLKKAVITHLDALEEETYPIFTRYLSPTERGNLILKATLSTIEHIPLSDAFRFVSTRNLITLCSNLVQYAKVDELKRIAIALAKVVSTETWTSLCAKLSIFSEMVDQQHDSLVEIFQIHKAITTELKDITAYCENIDIADQKQVEALAARFDFLKRVHTCHVEGEETVLLKELKDKLRESPCSSSGNTTVYEEHDEETALFSKFATLLDHLQNNVCRSSQNTEESIKYEKQKLVETVHMVTDHMIKHMEEEETNLLPLVRKHFSVEDQDRLMRLCMAKVPAELSSKVIPWIFNSLEVDEKEAMLRNILRTSSRDQICQILTTVTTSVRKGIIDRTVWNELCLRLPEIEEQYQSYVDSDKEENNGPVSEILRVHKAFRIELNDFLRRAKEIAADGVIPSPHYLRSLAESIAFLRKMVDDHSHAEDFILLPKLEEKAPGISEKYKDDHCDERKLFQDLAKCLEELQCVDDEGECERLTKKLEVVARILRDEMESHLTQEEEQMWPLLTKYFTREQQSEIVAMIFGHMPGSRLRELLPWMIRMLSVSERNTMMNHILQVTQSTMFEKWLKTWLPLDEDKHNQTATTKDNKGETVESEQNKNEESGSRSPQHQDHNPEVVSTARILLNGRDGIERTIRALARDSSLTVKERTRLMQQVMLAPYSQSRANTLAARRTSSGGSDDLTPTYVTGKDGVKRLGCKHYQRGCKVRAACCGKLYTCRLCHDDAEETHIMDRFATIEILCMYCQTLQPVASKCKNKSCGKQYARYFCRVCVFYDDSENRSIYHCHSCNVCRAGKGLGIDFFHCMKCNQCMNMKKYHNRGHVCIEKAMESDCPVCHQFLFTSTSPVKHLRCGHLMHTSCFQKYCKERFTCPLCSKSLEEIQPIFEKIDQQLASGVNTLMPREYRFARCDILCLDCNANSNTPYHFLYNKCPKCSSYNTRVEFVDANAGESHSRAQPRN